jgi:hypothetical protein
VQFSFSGSLDMAMSPAASMHPPSSSSQNYGAASASVAALDAAAEAADQLKRAAPLFRRDRPTDEAVSGPYHPYQRRDGVADVSVSGVCVCVVGRAAWAWCVTGCVRVVRGTTCWGRG